MTINSRTNFFFESLLFKHRLVDGLGILTLLLVGFAQYAVFVMAPSEQTLGAVQRILYFHVGSATACYIMIAVLLASGIFYLVTKQSAWDAINEAASGVAMAFATIVLITGMIWGHSSWNTWWRWEPRLVSFLVLWLILFSHRVIRMATDSGHQQRSFCAVLGILAAVNVPVVIFSIHLLAPTEQLHPRVVANQGLQDIRYVYAFVTGTFAAVLLASWLFVARLRNLILRHKLHLLISERRLFTVT